MPLISLLVKNAYLCAACLSFKIENMIAYDLFLISSTTLILSCLFCTILLFVLGNGSKARTILSIAALGATIFNGSSAVRSYFAYNYSLQNFDFFYSTYCIFLVYIIYIYLKTLMQPNENNRHIIIQFGCTMAFYLAVYAVLSIIATNPVLYSFDEIRDNTGNPFLWLRIAVYLHFIVVFCIFACKSARMYQHHKKAIARQFSYSEKISLSWLPYLLGLFIVIGFITFFDLPATFNSLYLNDFSNFFYAAFYLVVACLGASQQDIFTKNEPIVEENEDNGKNKSINIPATTRAQLQADLMKLMENNRIYLNPDLRLDSVVKELGTNRTYLSLIIKEDFGENFIGFVNRYRIDEAKQLLSDANNRTNLIEVAEKVGFKSISSFNVFFKRYTSQTPAEFRKSPSENTT